MDTNNSVVIVEGRVVVELEEYIEGINGDVKK